MRPPVFLFAFADDKDDHLGELNREKLKIAEILTNRQSEGHLLVDNNASTISFLRHQLLKYKPQVNVLHFSGHANSKQLRFEDQTTYLEGLIKSIQLQTNLQLVFLNGCSTKGQVNKLLDSGVPAVIATSVDVNDKRASDFAIAFYEALEKNQTIYESFFIAIQIITGKNGRTIHKKETGRHLGFLLEDDIDEESDKIEWGLYINKSKLSVKTWKIPDTSYYELKIKYEIQSYDSEKRFTGFQILQTLYDVLMNYSEDLEMFKELKRNHTQDGITNLEKFDIRDLKINIINSLPSPIGQQVRRLLTPEQTNDPKAHRLRYLINTYSVIVDLLAYIMLSQLWEEIESRKKDTNKKPLEINDESKKMILKFFSLTQKESRIYDIVPLIHEIRELFSANQVNFFVDEIEQLKDVLSDENGEFFISYSFLKEMKIKYADINNISQNFKEREIENDCEETEEKLCNIFKELGFCSKYKFATIKDIKIQKKKNRLPIYSHKMLELNYATITQGDDNDKDNDFENFTDTFSVVVYKLENRKLEAYNLYPFVFDSNTILKENFSKIYFLSYYDTSNAADTNCVFRYVENINNELDYLQIPLKKEFFLKDKIYKSSEKEVSNSFNDIIASIEEFLSNFK